MVFLICWFRNCLSNEEAFLVCFYCNLIMYVTH
uniref:Uncharacterized protein n=1 Tax=Aegilops tauschii subsp. strangulata TaxID=200361 RepID=A0A453IFL1_AEGTS